AVTVPVRRATWPSTASRASATAARVTSIPTGTGRSRESTASAATPPTSVARTSVTRSAGPSSTAPDRYRPQVSAAHVTAPYAIPASHPAPARPTGPAG